MENLEISGNVLYLCIYLFVGLIHLYVCAFIHSFIVCLFIRLFVCSFIRLFICMLSSKILNWIEIGFVSPISVKGV